ncbi:hypothetical protein PoB_006125300 [Plakobranchus ocellatus]|uniref:Uncharacterized protein n=1 Tax=Plakobranchus ocellatus TaxID=259542 RepID=A0AAV4CS83_9GAST|nr:hypothetical protein PoB_006125300 [Plakobranchus ocellatus]
MNGQCMLSNVWSVLRRCMVSVDVSIVSAEESWSVLRNEWFGNVPHADTQTPGCIPELHQCVLCLARPAKDTLFSFLCQVSNSFSAPPVFETKRVKREAEEVVGSEKIEGKEGIVVESFRLIMGNGENYQW